MVVPSCSYINIGINLIVVRPCMVWRQEITRSYITYNDDQYLANYEKWSGFGLIELVLWQLIVVMG